MAETIKHADPCFYMIACEDKNLHLPKYRALVDEVFKNEQRLLLMNPEYLHPKGRC